MPNRSIRDERQQRRKAGDMDQAARAAFKRKFQELGRPVRPLIKIPGKPARGPIESTTYRTETGRLRTRKERIDFEVERAQKGR